MTYEEAAKAALSAKIQRLVKYNNLPEEARQHYYKEAERLRMDATGEALYLVLLLITGSRDVAEMAYGLASAVSRADQSGVDWCLGTLADLLPQPNTSGRCSA